MSVGAVTLVGAGPGDPELLTLKAVRALAAADVVLVDELVNREILRHCGPQARIVHVGKRGGCRSTPQALIERLLVREARAGRRVVRLKGGDPFVFGRGGEEAATLRAAGIAVETVNGISAGLAAPAAVGIPLTRRGVAQGVVFVTGHPRERGGEPCWAALAATGLTLVLYMAMRRLEHIVEALCDGGADPELPACVIENATLPTQRRLDTTLAKLAIEARVGAYRSPAIVVIGAVAAEAGAMALAAAPARFAACQEEL